ncbi:hypothetical protein BCR44DRAFT_1455454 [Catenaria anguillulae PL171]|uniref:Uncharacterized protein n=1 Tax=Catenaria anguillulae PL171 TaxID=765915 RepID=A0A1Y2H222_9FUNG|nr:hypothetical protein BCR44DRAFT_1455454 [Catenaria anguillulae PL171]
MTPAAAVHQPAARLPLPTVLQSTPFIRPRRINSNSTMSCEPPRQRQPTRDLPGQL